MLTFSLLASCTMLIRDKLISTIQFISYHQLFPTDSRELSDRLQTIHQELLMIQKEFAKRPKRKRLQWPERIFLDE
jgi:hypothetical protein